MRNGMPRTVKRTAGMLAVTVIALVGTLQAQFDYRAKVVKIEDLTHDVRRVGLELEKSEGFSFTPGQYVFVRIPEYYVKQWNRKYGTDHEQVFRPYSFASSSSKLPRFDVIIKWARPPRDKDVPPGIASSFVHQHLRVGDVLEITEPTGTLYLRADTGEPIIIVAGGSGAAPFVSLLEYFFEREFDKNNEIYFFFGVRSKRDLFLHDRFLAWDKSKPRFHYIPALSHPRPDDNWEGETGYVQIPLGKRIEGPTGAHAYLAGPPIMIKFVEEVLRSKGITKDRTHYDEIEAR